MRGAYAIVDIEILARAAIDPIAFARQLVSAHPAALQLRAKTSSAREILAFLEALRPICSEAGVPLVNNDRVGLAAAAGCDMAHLGQDDLPIDVARKLAPSLGIGISTHTLAQLDLALKSRPTYVAFGPVFATTSKPNHEKVVGLNGLAAARKIIRESTAPKTPLVAIGGISAANVAAVMTHADMFAVIGALVGEAPAARLRQLQDAMGAPS